MTNNEGMELNKIYCGDVLEVRKSLPLDKEKTDNFHLKLKWSKFFMFDVVGI